MPQIHFVALKTIVSFVFSFLPLHHRKIPLSLFVSRARNGKSVHEIDELRGRFQTNPRSNSFTIQDPKVADNGNYTCYIADREFNVEAHIRVIGMSMANSKRNVGQIEINKEGLKFSIIH